MRNRENVRLLLSAYKLRRAEIKQRLKDFRKNLSRANKELFAELCFCLCTPQSKAVNCDEAVCRLKRNGLLFSGSPEEIARRLKGLVRFHNNKAGYIVEARKKFCDVGAAFTAARRACVPANLHDGQGQALPLHNDAVKIREWLVKNIKGLGMKEASHFLRNIGLGGDIAIIDRHILTNLKRYGVISKIPENISAKQYLSLEERMRGFSKKVGIPLAEMDLLFWSEETGCVFK